eukprot:m.311868 g.311868  ORF g.311868 m.311868 type:complete len:57 (+) comp16482_c0_seq66:653-823(+)
MDLTHLSLRQRSQSIHNRKYSITLACFVRYDNEAIFTGSATVVDGAGVFHIGPYLR